MKARMTRQSVYLLLLATLLLISVLVFALGFLIPQGKIYRMERLEKKKESLELAQFRQWHDETYETLKKLQSKHKRVIAAYENRFDAQRFLKTNRAYFESLNLGEIKNAGTKEEFTLYEVNATSRIDSPQSFYSFLESVNKSDWIIAVDFPIHFEREGESVRSRFTMRVYTARAQE